MQNGSRGAVGEGVLRLPHGRFELLAAAVLASTAPGVAAQSFISPGQVVEHVVSATDSTQSYALYVPSGYRAGPSWPVLFLMDPRGRALVPLRRFQAAAERDGFILVSSYNTLSDGPPAPNVTAMNAMLGDARATFSLDPHRYYLAGFSGTARVAWDFATQLNGQVAGIFGASAGTVRPTPWETRGLERPAVAFYGTAGTTDFNYEEMVGFRERVRGWGLPNRFRVFEGPHGWPPERLCSDALDWFAVEAMRSGLVPLRRSFVDSLYMSDTAEAAALERRGADLAAQQRYQEVLSAYDGLHDLRDVRARLSRLGRSHRLRKQVDERNRMLRDAVTYDRELFSVMARVRDAETPPDTADLMRRLRITRLQAAARPDDDAGYAARRLLEKAFVETSFYGPREELQRGDPDRALPLLLVASAIKPGNVRVLLGLARVHVRMGHPQQAMQELEEAVQAGASPSALSRDSAFASLWATPRFKALVGGH